MQYIPINIDVNINDLVIEKEPGKNIRMYLPPFELGDHHDHFTDAQEIDYSASLSPDDQDFLAQWRDSGKTLEIYSGFTDEPIDQRTFSGLLGEAYECMLVKADWAKTFHREPIQRLFELYRRAPAMDLGIDFGLPRLDDFFIADLKQAMHHFDFRFRREDTPGIHYTPNEESFRYIPRYIVPVYSDHAYSVSHLYELIDAVVQNNHELLERLTDRHVG